MARQTRPHHHRAGFAAGVVAGALLTAIMLVLGRQFGLFSLPELLGYRLIALLPLPLFSFFTATLGGGAKQLLFLGAVLGQVLVAGALGALWAAGAATLPGEERPRRRLPALWRPGAGGGLLFALPLALVVALVLLPLFGGGPLGSELASGPLANGLAAAGLAALYGLTLAPLYRRFMTPTGARPATGAPPLSRRALLRQFALGVAALAIGGAAIGALGRRGGVMGAGTGARAGGRVGDGDLPPEVTPNEDFYRVSKNFADPTVGEAGWKLEIGGMVERPYSLTLAEIRALPAVTDYRTLACISNEVGGDLISNAAWQGVPLRDLLERAGPRAGAVDLAVTGADGYTESFPIEKALDPGVLAAYAMNGVALPGGHGFPLRLLVPDIYGMKNVKWVTKLDVVGYDFKGFWQGQGWSDLATVRAMSRFDFPRARQRLAAGRARVGGVAFAGARGVAKVEVSADGGRTWVEGQLRRPLGPATWALWTAELDLPEGEHTLKVRATDGAGETQTDRPAPPLPDGATGWHTITVRAAAGL